MPFYFLLIYRKWLIFAIYAKSFWVFREKLQKQLNPNKVFSNVPGEPLGCHAKFKEIRDSYIAHDQNDFLDVRMGLVLQNNELKGVVCPPVQATFLYEENIEILLAMCRITYCFIVNILDEEVNKIHQKYENEWDIEAIRLLPEMELAL